MRLLMWRYKSLFLVCCILTLTVAEFGTHNLTSRANGNPNSKHFMVKLSRGTEPITVFLRMAGKLKKHRTRFYCDFYRSTTLFWPASFGKTVVVLDEESEQDHTFAKLLSKQVKEHFPNRKLEVFYEPLPNDQSILNFPGRRTPGYNRQLWSSFFIDLYTKDNIIAWMDSDAAFITPVKRHQYFLAKSCGFWALSAP